MVLVLKAERVMNSSSCLVLCGRVRVPKKKTGEATGEGTTSVAVDTQDIEDARTVLCPPITVAGMEWSRRLYDKLCELQMVELGN